MAAKVLHLDAAEEENDEERPCKRLRGSAGDEEESKELRALRSFQVRQASRCREALVNQWREVSRPRRAGAVARLPAGARLDFHPLFQEWLEVRGLGDALEHAEDRGSWAIYRYKREPVVSAEESWEAAFHGTWWYSVWLVLESGVLLESNDWDKGHDFWEPGVYCSPNLETARWYARPHVLFGDDAYHRVVFELRVDSARRKRNRQRGGVQWVFPTGAVALHAVWVQINSPPQKGEERVNEWDADLEALPLSREKPEPTTNPRDGPWSEVEDEEEAEEEEYSLPPHLAGANPIRPSLFRRPRPPANGASEAIPGSPGVGQRSGVVAERPSSTSGPIRPSARAWPRLRGSAALAPAWCGISDKEPAVAEGEALEVPRGGAAPPRKNPAKTLADAADVHATLARMEALAKGKE
mmetsp:Transcript_92384/g.270444  ORF Transcript_92384/g.270444 Transcript_92384/m.270444 type:complete len:412 (-) Transcript_92384:118-1353(-)